MLRQHLGQILQGQGEEYVRRKPVVLLLMRDECKESVMNNWTTFFLLDFSTPSLSLGLCSSCQNFYAQYFLKEMRQ